MDVYAAGKEKAGISALFRDTGSKEYFGVCHMSLRFRLLCKPGFAERLYNQTVTYTVTRQSNLGQSAVKYRSNGRKMKSLYKTTNLPDVPGDSVCGIGRIAGIADFLLM